MFKRSFWLTNLAAVVISSFAFATPSIQALFLEKYPALVKTKLDTCAVCHMPGADMNPYAMALKKAKLDFAAVEGLDSDGDGKTNKEEIDLLTFPGSALAEFEVFPFPATPGTVTFNHGSHVTKASYKIMGDCTVCHDAKDPNKFDKMLFDPKIKVMKQAHATCLGCHTKMAIPSAPTKCNECHKK